MLTRHTKYWWLKGDGIMSRTKYMNKQMKEKYNLSQYPNAGPNPSIIGMKNLYWGKDAYCIKSGEYVYKVPKEIWDKA